MVSLVVTGKLTTPTEVKAATMLMRVGIMLNFPACNRRTAFGDSFDSHSIVKVTTPIGKKWDAQLRAINSHFH